MKRRIFFGWGLLALLLAALSATAGEKTQSFPATKGGLLEVRADAGSITVRGWEKDEVFVRVRALNDDQLKEVTMSQGGGKVLVEFRTRNHAIEEMEFDISVPSSFDTDLNTGGGELSVFPPLSGNLKGSTAGGRITLGDLGGTIRMETAGGEIEGGDIAGDITVRTAGGDIEIKNVAGTADLSTAGGNVTVGSSAKALRVSTAGGNIKIGKAGSDLMAETAGGNLKIRSAQGNISLRTAGGNIELASARGKVSASTSAGNVQLSDVQGSVTARTAAGDITLTIDPAAGESSALQTSAGNIELVIPATARASITARARRPLAGWDEEDNEAIRSDFPLQRPEGRRGEMQREVILNGGGHRITLDTMIGTINIKKAK